jgi:hypothetical protein
MCYIAKLMNGQVNQIRRDTIRSSIFLFNFQIKTTWTMSGKRLAFDHSLHYFPKEENERQ